MPSTGVPSVLFQVTTSVSPSAMSRSCGLTSVSFFGDANVRSLTYTSAGAFGEPSVYAASRPSVDCDGLPISILSTTRFSLPAATSYAYTALHARSPVVNSMRLPSGVHRGVPGETSAFAIVHVLRLARRDVVEHQMVVADLAIHDAVGASGVALRKDGEGDRLSVGRPRRRRTHLGFVVIFSATCRRASRRTRPCACRAATSSARPGRRAACRRATSSARRSP